MGFSFNTLSSSSTFADLNANFTAIENKLGNITNSDVAESAGFTSQKLQDRYCPSFQTVVLRGIDVADSGDTWGDTGAVIVAEDEQSPGSSTIRRVYPEVPGKRAYLCGVSIWVGGYTAGSSGDADLNVFHNSTLISAVSITGNGVSHIRAGSGSTAYASPIAALQTGDYLGFSWTAAVGGDNPRAEFITITFSYKMELVS